MKKVFKTRLRTLLSFIVAMAIISCMTLFFLFINCYEVSMVLGISSLFNFFYLMLILNYGANSEEKELSKGGKVFLFTSLRSLIEIFCLIVCALAIYFTKNSVFDSKYRFLFILFSLIPYFIAIWFFSIHSKIGEDRVFVKDSK